jgi:hypothetical protein
VPTRPILWWLLGGALVVYLLSRTQRGQEIASDAVEFAAMTAREIAQLPRGLRNKNPGNIGYLPPLKAWRGQVGRDGALGVYDTDQNGVRAIGQELLLDARRGVNTVRELITSWAPPNENDTETYIKNVCKWVGVGASDRIDVRGLLPQLVSAIIRQENTLQPFSLSEIQTWVYS